jgi:hypothetical protein
MAAAAQRKGKKMAMQLGAAVAGTLGSILLKKAIGEVTPAPTSSLTRGRRSRRPARPRATRRGRSRPIAYGTHLSSSGKKTNRYAGKDTYVESISGSDAFTCNSYAVNPGLSDRFRSAAVEAARYDRYSFSGLKFTWIPSVAVTTTPGMVAMAFDPNPDSSCPEELSLISSYECFKMFSVYEKSSLFVPASFLKGTRFVRNGPKAQALTLYDPGTFVIATQDMGATAKCGFIEVEYIINFKHYHLSPPDVLMRNLASYSLSANDSLSTGVVERIDFQTTDYDNIGIEVVDTSQFHAPPGLYRLTGSVELYNPSSTTYLGVTIVPAIDGAAIPGITPVYHEFITTVADTRSVPFNFVFPLEDGEHFALDVEANFTGTCSVNSDHTYLNVQVV